MSKVDKLLPYLDFNCWGSATYPDSVQTSNGGIISVVTSHEVLILLPSFRPGRVFSTRWIRLNTSASDKAHIEEMGSNGGGQMEDWLDAQQEPQFRSAFWSERGTQRNQLPLLVVTMDSGYFVICEITGLESHVTEPSFAHLVSIEGHGVKVLSSSLDFYEPRARERGLKSSKINDIKWIDCGGPSTSSSCPLYLLLTGPHVLSLWLVKPSGIATATGSLDVTCASNFKVFEHGDSSDYIVAINSCISLDNKDIQNAFIVTFKGTIIKVDINMTSHTYFQVHSHTPERAVQPSPSCIIKVFQSHLGNLLCISNGETFRCFIDQDGTTEAELSSSDESKRTNSDMHLDLFGITGISCMNTASRGFVIMRENVSIFNQLEDPGLANNFSSTYEFHILLAFRCGKIRCIGVSRPDLVSSSSRPRNSLIGMAATMLGDVETRLTDNPKTSLAMDSLDLVMFHTSIIPPKDLDAHEAQCNRLLLKHHSRVSIALTPCCLSAWTHIGDEVIRLLLDHVILARPKAVNSKVRNCLSSLPMAILHSAVAHPPASYVHALLEKIENSKKTKVSVESNQSIPIDLSHGEDAAVAMDVETADIDGDDAADYSVVDTIVSKSRKRHMIEETVQLFRPEDNTSLIEAVDIFIRAAMICVDAVNRKYEAAVTDLRSDGSQEIGDTEASIRLNCRQIIQDTQFSAINGRIKYLGGIDNLLAALNAEGEGGLLTRFFDIIPDRELLSIKLRIMQCIHVTVWSLFRLKSIPISPLLDKFLLGIRQFIRFCNYCKSILRLLRACNVSHYPVSVYNSVFDVKCVPTSAPQAVRNNSQALSSSERLTVQRMIQFLRFYGMSRFEVTFSPHVNSEMIAFLVELSRTADTLCSRGCESDLRAVSHSSVNREALKCPCCDSFLSDNSAISDPTEVNSICLPNMEYFPCTTCGLSFDACALTLLPSICCNLDNDSGMGSTNPLGLRCPACGSTTNSSRLIRQEHEELFQYSWLSYASEIDCLCPFCSISMLPDVI